MIVTRFAPSPTGLLHLGHAFAALTAEHTARMSGGRFLLRIEDIDQARCHKEFEAAIETDLSWLGIAWERPVRRQSEHFDDYAEALSLLERRGLLYPCFCTRKEIAEEIRRAGEAPHLSTTSPDGPLYPGTCRSLNRDEREERMARGLSYALRLDVAKAAREAGPLDFEERGRGPAGEHGRQNARPDLSGDVVLARKEMQASYHLAVVVDDAIQGVTLVTRGNDLFPATHVQRLLQTLLGLPEPAYAHHRLITDADGKKFSKRDKAATLQEMRETGTCADELRSALGFA